MAETTRNVVLREIATRITDKTLRVQLLAKSADQSDMQFMKDVFSSPCSSEEIEQVFSLWIEDKKEKKSLENIYSSVENDPRNKREKLDCWTHSRRSTTEQKQFKNTLLDFYERQEKGSTKIHCMVLNVPYEREHVIASHLWKFATHGKGLEAFELDPSAVSTPRNGLLLAKGIEDAFDHKQVCFIWDPLAKQIKFVVLDPSIKDKTIFPSTSSKFSEYNGKLLHHPVGKIPFRRILSFHASCAFEEARRRQWITEEEFKQYEDYLHLSDDASDEE